VPAVAAAGGFLSVSNDAALLHRVDVFGDYNDPSGFFAQAQAHWYVQDNRRDSAGLADTDFWHFDVFAGWRLWQRRVEARAGILNLANQDYRLNPLNLAPELPRRRTFTASLRFNF
jgi:hypothetical protein